MARSKTDIGVGVVSARKPRRKTPSFIAEFPVRATAAQEHVLLIRLDAARQIYNAALGESLRRLDLVRESKAYQMARKMPRTTKEQKKLRAEEFERIAELFGYSSGEIQKFAQTCRDGCWIGEHLGSHDMQTTSLRAFRAAQQYGFGKRGRPQFKKFGTLNSVEGKSNGAVITYRDVSNPAVRWSGLHLPLVVDARSEYQAEALTRHVKYVRVLRRLFGNRDRWYAQLICEGLPPAREAVTLGKDHRGSGPKIVGLDVGPSTIGIVTDTGAFVRTLAASVVDTQNEIRLLQRQMNRSRRASNPQNFNKNGTVKKGPKKWVRSVRYSKLAAKKRNLERVKKAERKRSHGQLQNEIIRAGTVVKSENISYRSLQRNYGKSVGVRAPGLMISGLERKLKSLAGGFVSIGTRHTRLSQYDHTTDDFVKKSLSLREHVLGDGSGVVQRDIYSAFLARYCDETFLDARQAVVAWPSMESFLVRTASRCSQPATSLLSSDVSQAHVDSRLGRVSASEVVVRTRGQSSGARLGRCNDSSSNAISARTQERSDGSILRIFGVHPGE